MFSWRRKQTLKSRQAVSRNVQDVARGIVRFGEKVNKLARVCVCVLFQKHGGAPNEACLADVEVHVAVRCFLALGREQGIQGAVPPNY